MAAGHGLLVGDLDQAVVVLVAGLQPQAPGAQIAQVQGVVEAPVPPHAVLAAAAGFLFVMKYPGMNQPAHAIWVLLGLKAFVAAVIGGIGNVRGAVLGGFVIAFVEQFGAFYVSSNYRDVYVFALLIVILLVKPSGLLGSPIREKV